MSTIIVPCPGCQGDGGFEHVTGFDPFNGCERVRFSHCETCDGSGSVEEETAVRTLADLEEEDFDMLEAGCAR